MCGDIITIYFLLFLSVANFADATSVTPKVLALRLQTTDDKSFYNKEGQITFESNQDLKLEIISEGVNDGTYIKLITEKMDMGSNCDNGNGSVARIHTPYKQIARDGTIKFSANEVLYDGEHSTFYVCAKINGTFIHQGHEDKVLINVIPPAFLPVWANFIFLAILLCLSGLFSGLNLGLMSLDTTELEIVKNTGTEEEKRNASTILPVRGGTWNVLCQTSGNYLLCTLLFGNVLVNVLIPLLLDGIPGANGPIAVAGSTFGIVIFGEIIPQALCSRHGLSVGAKTMFLTKMFMFLTFPLSFPISKILDLILGEEIGTKYDRQRLIELLRVADHDLDDKQVNMLGGALALKDKCVKQIMTPIKDAYMLPLETTLNFKTIYEIKSSGHSRIPVYQGDQDKIVYILMAKDLLFVDPDDEKPLEEICKFYEKPFIITESKRQLDIMLDEFRTGEKGHLAIVKEDDEVIGLVTLEDIIEEIIQFEIIDEDDRYVDNRSKKKTKILARSQSREYEMWNDPSDKRIEVPPQIIQAVHQYLSSSIDSFNPTIIKPEILKKLLNLNVFHVVKESTSKEDEETECILKQGVASDSFLLIVEGKVEVQIGSEGYVFESGPFTVFGKSVLEFPDNNVTETKTRTWIPDCSIRLSRGEVLYFSLRSTTYKSAVLASKRVSTQKPEEIEKQIQMMRDNQDGPQLHEEATLLSGI